MKGLDFASNFQSFLVIPGNMIFTKFNILVETKHIFQFNIRTPTR